MVLATWQGPLVNADRAEEARSAQGTRQGACPHMRNANSDVLSAAFTRRWLDNAVHQTQARASKYRRLPCGR